MTDPTQGAAGPRAGRRRAGALLACAWLAGCAGLETGGAPTLNEVAARMPREIAGFMLGDSGRASGSVLSLDYATANRAAVAAVLVYEAAGRSAPSDPSAPEIERELTAAVAEVTEVPYGRTGRRLAERQRITLADPGLRCAVMEGSFGRAPVTRHICVGGAQGRFVKVQVTMPSRTPPPADALAFAAGALRAVRAR